MDISPLVQTWTKKHKIRIPYYLRGRKKHYLPDILVEYKDGSIYLEEVKGVIFNSMKFGLKNLAALGYCARHGIVYRIIYKEGLDTVA